jgi:hypothetical protein
MRTKFQLTIEKMLERDGNAYVTARNILNLRVLSIMGIGLDDLPDTAGIADIVEVSMSRPSRTSLAM